MELSELTNTAKIFIAFEESIDITVSSGWDIITKHFRQIRQVDYIFSYSLRF